MHIFRTYAFALRYFVFSGLSLSFNSPSRISFARLRASCASHSYLRLRQLKLRKALSERNETIPDQKGKPTVNPTMRRVFQIFEGISLLIESKDGNEKIVGMINLKEIHRKILALLGSAYEKIYLC